MGRPARSGECHCPLVTVSNIEGRGNARPERRQRLSSVVGQ